MKPIFNSLGSNYNLKFTLSALTNYLKVSFQAPSSLKNYLESKFSGTAYLTYKGRDAIELALKALNIGSKNSVLTQAFTCYAVEEGITRTGATPVFVDLAKNQLNPSIKNLNNAFKTAKNPKAVIIQHTLGYPADIKKIKSWCLKHKLYLIEDLAQSYGATDKNNQILGTHADAIILSFGRDKIIDAISGGAAIIKTKHQHLPITKKSPRHIAKYEALYPLITLLIRSTYPVGKLLHLLLKKTQIFASPITSPTTTISSIHPAAAALALYQIKHLDQQLSHRQQISCLYQQSLKSLSLTTITQINRAANLRFPIKVNHPKQLIGCLQKQNIFISDRWYRAPVDCGSFNLPTKYQSDSCPNAEKLSSQIINLPTHINISKQKAFRLTKTVQLCLDQ